MARRRTPAAGTDYWMEFAWPTSGLDRAHGYEHALPLTCREAQNVRSYNPLDHRLRGGPRQGTTKMFTGHAPTTVAIDTTVVHKVQCLDHVVAILDPIPSGGVNPRKIYGVAVAHGDVRYWLVGTSTSYTTATNGAAALSLVAPAIFSAEHTQKLFFVDGVKRTTTVPHYFDASDVTVKSWEAALTATSTLPIDSANYTPRLICTWRGRLVLSGLLNDPQNWFMSAVNNPFDWDYSPTTPSETQAVAGNLSPAGKIGDPIRGLVPASDDTLIFLGDRTVWRMTGDPAAGGRVDLITDAVGGVFGEGWAKDDVGDIYFFGNTGGVFRLPRGSMQLERISIPVDEIMTHVNGMLCRMLWDHQQQGLHVFRTSPDGLSTINFFWDKRNTAWWPDVFANPLHNPCAVTIQDGDSPNDRFLLLGGQDGYVRYFDATANDDDGTAMVTHVMLGPIMEKEHGTFLFKEMQAVLELDPYGFDGATPVRWFMYTAEAAERAVQEPIPAIVPIPPGTSQLQYRTFDLSGFWKPGRNYPALIRREGTSFYLWLFNVESSSWRFERLDVKLRSLGMVRDRYH